MVLTFQEILELFHLPDVTICFISLYGRIILLTYYFLFRRTILRLGSGISMFIFYIDVLFTCLGSSFGVTYLTHLYHMWNYHCRVTKTLSIQYAGILLVSIWHQWVTTWLECGRLAPAAKGNAFMSWAVVATNFIPVFSIPLILLYWSLVVMRQVTAALFCHAISQFNLAT